MKKFILAAMLGLFSFAANANSKVKILNALPPCPGMTMTITFHSYAEGICTPDIDSWTYTITGGEVFDMCDPSIWNGTLWMPSYETFSATICVQCAGMAIPFCTAEVGLDCLPGHECIPLSLAPVPFAGCCFGSIGADCTPGGGGACMLLKIHP